MTNVARDLLWPTDPEVLLRAAFLHVGQGSSAVVLAADGGTYQTMLVDIHLDEDHGGVDVPRLAADLVEDGRLDVFVNSHPHNDHLCGIEKLHDAVGIGEIWHSGHIPSVEHEGAYQELQRVIDRVIEEGGVEEELCGSRTPRPFGEAECYVLAPAQHVQDEIDDETPEERDERIHEYCAVLRVGAGDTWVLLPGDADRDAWELHITGYHRERLPSQVLAAPHHGSRTFFKHDADEDPYLDAIEAIGPDWVIISAPTREESPHGHPHEDAVALYADAVGEDNVLHTGAARHCFVADVYRDGRCEVWSDEGQLVAAYGLGGGGNDGGTKSRIDGPPGGPSIRRSGPRIVREAPPFA